MKSGPHYIVQGSKQEVTKVDQLVKLAENYEGIPVVLKL